MSPLFGKHQDGTGREGGAPDPDEEHLPRLIDSIPALDAAVKGVAAMPLTELAARLMKELFGSEYQPRGNAVDIDAIAGPLLPPHSPAKFGDPTPPGASILWDLAAEAIQLLEHAGLIVGDLWYSGEVACFGYHSTRAGRTAVEQGTVLELVS